MTIRKRGRVYWYDFMIDRTRYRGSLKACRTLAEARRAEAKLKASVYDGSYRTDDGWIFKRFVEEVYLPWSKVNKRSYQSDTWRSDVLIEFFGLLPLTEITPLIIEQFKSWRKSGKTKRRDVRSAASVNRELELLSSMFTLALNYRIVVDNPCQRVRKFKLDNRRERVLSPTEETLLMKALLGPRRYHLRAMVVLCLNTGMRRGEISRLTWRDVNFDQSEMFVRRSKTGFNSWIPMNRTVIDLLLGLPRVAGDDDNPLFGVRWINNAWRILCRDCKIKNLNFHDLRHTFASRLMQSGASLQTVRDFLGHTAASTTLRYTHSSSGAMRDAVGVLEEKPGDALSQNLSQSAI